MSLKHAFSMGEIDSTFKGAKLRKGVEKTLALTMLCGPPKSYNTKRIYSISKVLKFLRERAIRSKKSLKKSPKVELRNTALK